MRDAAMPAENRLYYEQPALVQAYANRTDVLGAEEALLGRCDTDLRGRDVLDIGVGAGRMTPYVAPIAARYSAVDFSARMIDVCRAKFPGLDFRVGDARDLGMFDAHSFDTICMFGSAIDDVDPLERSQVLAEICRLLRPCGLFLFSSHNLDAQLGSPWRFRKSVRRTLAGIANRLRLRHRVRRGDGWAILNDQSGNFSLMTLYVDPRWQRRMLEERGFGEIEMFALDGRALAPGEVCGDHSLYYTARLTDPRG
jgi:SAM-dependent methyltransferase